MRPRHLILASTSPRRKELLALLGISFDIIPPDSNEGVLAGEHPVHHVRRLALEKAHSVANRYPASWVIGSDTVIEIDNQILGKPKDLDDAEHMLTLIRGRHHHVHTGIALVHQTNRVEETRVESVTVWIKNFSVSQLQDYLHTKDSLGKAGAYSIQGEGARLIEKIEGDYPAVVGLPLWQIAQLLKEHSFEMPNRIEEIYIKKPYANWKEFS